MQKTQLIDLIKELKEKLFLYLFNLEEWKIFMKRTFSLLIFSILLFTFWMFPTSLFVAPFYSTTKDKVENIKTFELEGKTTAFSVKDGIQDLLDEGLVTNFTGVKTWIDNRYNQQVGSIEMYRIAINTLENNLGRNRGTGGANSNLVKARSNIYADYDLPIFTSYTTRLNQTVSHIDDYIIQLEQDKDLKSSQKEAVFIINSDNLAEVFDKLKQQLQTNLKLKTTFFTEDDKFYKLKGNLIAISNFLKGIDYDFKNKMIDKTSYEENFVPLLEAVDNAIGQNHIIILETMGHVSKLEKEANVISQKMAELRDKLRNG
jgi:hypothetical protein